MQSYTYEDRDGNECEFVLDKLLPGLRTTPTTDPQTNKLRNKSQAEVFVSFATQMGFTTEDEIVALKPSILEPYEQSGTSYANSASKFMSEMRACVEAAQQVRARETMGANPASQSSLNYLTTLQGELLTLITMIDMPGPNAAKAQWVKNGEQIALGYGHAFQVNVSVCIDGTKAQLGWTGKPKPSGSGQQHVGDPTPQVNIVVPSGAPAHGTDEEPF